jgi:hypothetical protein
MKIAIPALLLALTTAASHAPAQEVLIVPGGNSRETYFTVHNLAAAHRLATGKGVKVGILDHYFGVAHHPELYAGGENFLPEDSAGFREASEHGYWMALVLREIAPGARIYALNTAARDEGAKAAAMARAIDWAIAHDLDVLTYSDRAFSAAARSTLDAAVERAHRAGIVTTFIHYPGATNLLPGWIGPRTGDDGREPDVNILQFDYSKIFVARLAKWQDGRATGIGNHPFLSLSSTSVVTAGMVALLLSADTTLQPAALKAILMTTSRPYTLDGMTGTRVPDAHAAVLRALDH